jgi:hypothetical protein
VKHKMNNDNDDDDTRRRFHLPKLQQVNIEDDLDKDELDEGESDKDELDKGEATKAPNL